MTSPLRSQGYSRHMYACDMPTKKARGAVTEFIAHTLREMLRSGSYKSKTALTAELQKYGGPSRPHLTNILDGTRGAGPDTINAIASKFYAGSKDELEKAARAYAEANGLVRVEEERYPNRERAEKALISLGNDPADVRRWSEAIGVSLDSDEDPPAEEWWLPQMQLERARERSARKMISEDTPHR
jgi:hypothetical protein